MQRSQQSLLSSCLRCVTAQPHSSRQLDGLAISLYSSAAQSQSSVTDLRSASLALGTSTAEHSSSDGWLTSSGLKLLGAGLALCTFASGAAVAAEPDVDGADRMPETARGANWSILGLEKKRRIFFKYEKRIRDNSALEKVFDYFSSAEKDGVRAMTQADMLAALVPAYPASQSVALRAGSLDGEPRPAASHRVMSPAAQTAGDSIFKAFDVDGDGLMDFMEFKLILTLLAIPMSDVATIFKVVDLDSDGSIDAQEFNLIMLQLMGMANVSQSNKHTVGRISRLDTKGTPSGLLVTFFGQDQTGRLTLAQLTRFLTELHTNLIRLEFAHYDVGGKGEIPGLDFGRSLVASADIKMVDSLLGKVDSLPEFLLRAPISWAEFAAVSGLQGRLHELQVAFDFYNHINRTVTKVEFSRIVHKLIGVQLSDKVLDILLHIFGDASGTLDTSQLMETLRRKHPAWRRGQESAPETLAKVVRAGSWW